MDEISPEAKHIGREKELAAYAGPDRVVSSIEMAEMYKNRPVIAKHATGILELDKAIDGFEDYELIVISGPTSMGKTLLCDTIMTNLREESKFSLFFTFEVSPEKIVINHSTPESVIFLPLEHKSMDLQWLKDRCQEAKIKYGCQAIFIDHLHYVIDLMTHKNMSLEIGFTMRSLKRMALELKLPVFIVCHSKMIPKDESPSIEHIRDSSFVGQEADTVLIVTRRYDKVDGKDVDSFEQGLAKIKVAKARRNGISYGKEIKIRKIGTRLMDSVEEYDH